LLGDGHGEYAFAGLFWCRGHARSFVRGDLVVTDAAPGMRAKVADLLRVTPSEWRKAGGW
jgi:hypothetical protein